MPCSCTSDPVPFLSSPQFLRLHIMCILFRVSAAYMKLLSLLQSVRVLPLSVLVLRVLPVLLHHTPMFLQEDLEVQVAQDFQADHVVPPHLVALSVLEDLADLGLQDSHLDRPFLNRARAEQVQLQYRVPYANISDVGILIFLLWTLLHCLLIFILNFENYEH